MAQPHCLYCDTPRPAEVARCPECGHPWIDVTIAEALQPSRDRAAPIEPTPEPGPGRAAGVPATGRPRWFFPVAVTAAAVLVYAIVFAVLIDRSGSDRETEPPDASATTAVSEPPVSTGPDVVATTIAPPPTTVPATTEPPPTTIPPTTLPPIPPLGDPIPVEELTLGAFSLGPMEFGDADVNALGRLVATFGQPDEVWEIGEADGLCPTESGRAARFGWLTVLVRDEAGTEVLVAYRLGPPADVPPDDPTENLQTISGAKIGDTSDRWADIYATSIVRQTQIDGAPYLLLLRSSDERTLLWAPLSDDDPPLVLGIYSPEPCDGGPFG